MKYFYTLFFSVLILSQSGLCESSKALTQPDLTVGRNLEVGATVTLPEIMPMESVEITLTSGDPKRVLLSTAPDAKGTASIILAVRPGLIESPEFYVQGVGELGTTTYTATAPGFGTSTAKVNVAPSGIVVTTGGVLTNASRDNFMVTVGTTKPRIRVYSALLDSSLRFVANQPVAGGSTVKVDVASSDLNVGTLEPTQVELVGGRDVVTTGFIPKSAGSTALSVNVPAGFAAPARYARLTANVLMPGLVISDNLVVGKHLEGCDFVISSQRATEDGLAITVTSDNPNLLLFTKHEDAGAQSVKLTMPIGENQASYCMEALADSGKASITASAPGFRSRTTTVTLTPSGLTMGFNGPPDEAEIFREDAGSREHGIVMELSEGTKTLTLYMERLNATTHRGADISLQALRGGKSVKVEVESSNTTVGIVDSPVTLEGIQTITKFTALKPGKTVLTVKTPEGFTTAANSASYTVIVKDTPKSSDQQ